MVFLNRLIWSVLVSALLLGLGEWTLRAQVPPSISGESGERLVLPGTTVILAPNVSGTSPFSYQWLFDDAPLPGETNSSLTLIGVQALQTGSYGLVVTNSYGTATATLAHLTVLPTPPPTVVGAWGWNETVESPTLIDLFAVVSVHAGLQHALALKSDGSVAGWGNNAYQQLNVPAALTNAAVLAAGAYHNLGLRSDGTVVAWGDNSAGQCAVPAGLSNVLAIAAGGFHSLALSSNGTMVAWGNNSYGQGTAPAGIGIPRALAAGGYFSAALLEDGQIVAWGFNGNGQTNVPATVTNAIALSAGYNHCLALRRDGSVAAWGYNGSGQTNVPPNLSNVVAVAAGFDHSLALKSDGTVVGWGSSEGGQTRLPSTLTNLVAIAAGNAFSVGITAAPVIRGQPGSRLLVPSTSATFGVQAYSALPMAFQWRLNGAELPGATNAWFTLTNMQAADAGSYSVVVSNLYGALASSAAVLSLAPVVQWPPTNRLEQIGRDAQFTVTAVSTAPLSYQWQFKGADIPGATSATYTRSKAQATHVGDYRARVTSSVGSVTSAPAWLALVSADQSARPGDNLSLSITSALPVSVQWQFNGVNLLNQTNRTLTLTNLQLWQSGNYRVVCDDGFAPLASPEIAVTVFLPPSITSSPASQTAVVGSEPRFAVGVSGTPPLSFQWFFNNSRISGATNAFLAIPNVQLTNAGSYRVTVTNYAGAVTSSIATLTIYPRPPTILSQPRDWVTIAGTNVSFSVLATGFEPLMYQWQLNNVSLPGETNAVLTLTNVQLANAGRFQVVLSNAEASVTSRVATLTVFPGEGGVYVSWGATGQASMPTGLCEVVAVAPGLALKRDGRVFMLGYGLATPGGGSIAAMSGTSDSALGIKSDGTIVAWGFGYSIGPPSWLSNVVSIAKGSVAVRSDGTAVGFGEGLFSPQGAVLPVANVAAAAVGAAHWVALKGDGTVAAFGDNSYGQLNVPAGLSGVKGIACGGYHTLALRSNGTVVAWGLNDSGQSTVPPGLNDIKAIGCGEIHSLAVRSNGTVVAWGYNEFGQCNVPAGLSNVVAVAGDYWKSVALKAVNLGISTQPVGVTNMVGSNASFSVVAYSSEPVSYQWFLNDVPLAGATNATLALTNIQLPDDGHYKVQVSNSQAMCESDAVRLAVVPWPWLPFPGGTTGRVVAWGRNLYGETNVPAGLSNAAAISSGSMALSAFGYTADGRIVQWGRGVGLRASLSNLVYVTGGESYNLGLNNNGTTLIWGSADYTYVPEGIAQIQAISYGGPKIALRTDGVVLTLSGTALLTSVSNATAIAAGKAHALALLKDGTVVLDQYPYGNSEQTPVPPGLCNVAAIAAGLDHCLALHSNGTVTAWGKNASGQCSVPFGLSNIIAIAAAGDHSLALKADRTVVAWGDSAEGLNQPPAGLTNVIAIACGWNHNIALRAGPVFTRVPTNVVAAFGATVTFQVVAEANNAITYQWLFNGSPIPGATDPTLTLNNVQAAQAGDYSLQATADRFTAVASARLSFGAPPAILGAPADVWVRPGEQAVFQVLATNATALCYQWSFENKLLPGETNNTLILTNAQAPQAGRYSVRVFTPWNLDTNLTATLYVLSLKPMGSVVTWEAKTNAPPGLSGVIQVAAGANSSAALRADGTVVEWNNKTAAYNSVPSNVTRVVSIACGGSHTLALRQDGTVVGWGSNSAGEAAPPNIWDARAVAAGPGFSVVVRSNGTPMVWGQYSAPLFNVPAEATDLASVAAGLGFILGLRNDGTLVGWGSRVPPPGLSSIVAIAAGDQNSLALRADGQVLYWGPNYFGETNIPPDLSNVAALATHYSRCLALLTNGTVRGWGRVTPPSNLSSLVDISAGGNISLGVRETGVFIVRQPRGAAVLASSDVTLTVEAIGVSPLSYQWRLNGMNIAGANSATLALTDVQDAQAGNYTVLVSTSIGASLSAPAQLTVLSPPRFLVQPASQTIPAGANVTFWAQAAGTAPLAYQWLSNGVALTGQTATNLSLSSVTTVATNAYQLRVTNAYGAITSAPAFLTVQCPPLILTQPASQNVLFGSNTTFAVSASGTAPLAYRWRFNDADIPGATDPVLNVTNAQPGAAGTYRVVLANAFGAVTSAPASLSVLALSPTILSPPADRLVPAGSSASFSVVASGVPPLSYQWRRNSSPLPGCTGAALNILNVQGTDVARYDVMVTNFFGATTSAPALLQVGPNPNVVAWGINHKGQTNVPADLTNIVAVAADLSHALALRLDGTVSGWGGNDYGQASIPAGLSNVVALAAGNYHSLALRSNGTVVGWGADTYGQATPPTGLSNVIAIAAGSFHSLALKQDGTAVGWGNNRYGQASAPASLTNAVAIATGENHSIALRQDGTLAAWGYYYDDPTGISNVVAISGKNWRFLLLRDDGTILDWRTKAVEGPSNVVAVSAGASHSGEWYALALLSNGSVCAWGANAYGQSSPPSGLTSVISIAAGYDFGVAVKGGAEFITQPISQTVLEGESAAFSGEIYSFVPTTLQWQVNGTNIAGATNSILFIPSVQFAHHGVYTLVASNRLGITRSAAATLTVIPNVPVLIAGPVEQTVVVGGTAVFSVSALGRGPLTYQWRFNGSIIPGATGTNLTLSNVTSNNIGSYSVVVSNPYGATESAPATLLVLPTELIVDNLQAQVSGWWYVLGYGTDHFGADYRLKEQGLGAGTASFIPTIPQTGVYEVYEWHPRSSAHSVGAPHFIQYDGGAQLLLVNQQTNGGRWNLLGTFPFAAGNAGRVRISDAIPDGGRMVAADAIKFVYVPPPLILTPPQSQFVMAGGTADFRVAAASASPMSFQWQKDNNDFTLSTLDQLQLANVQLADAGVYRVIVRNAGGSATSAATLNVGAPLAISAANGSATLLWAGPFVLQTATNVAGPYVDVPGATSPWTMTITGEPQRFFRLRLSAEPALSPLSQGAGRAFQVSVPSVGGFRYSVQASTNLRDWTTVFLGTAPFTFTDLEATNLPARFYRAVWTP